MSRVTRRLVLALPGLAIALGFAFGLRRLDNTDTWWHLAGGRWIVAHRTIPWTDPLSWTVPDHPWINVQWLYDVVLYGLYQVGGPSFLVVVSALAYTLAAALLVMNVRRHVGPLLTTLLCAWAILVSQERFAIRPEMVSFPLLQVVLWIYGTGRTDESRRLWLLPAVMGLWANCHSLFIVGDVLIACHMVGSLVTDLPIFPAGWRRPISHAVRRNVLVTGLAGLAATALGPFGVTGATFPLILMSRINGDHPLFRGIGEMRRPWEGYFVTFSVTAYQVLFVFSVTVVLAALALAALQRGGGAAGGSKGAGRAERRRKGMPPPAPRPETPERRAPFVHVDLADIAAFAGLAYLSLLARRNMALFALGGMPCVAACLALLATRLPQAATRVMQQLEVALAVVVAPALVAAGWFIASNGFFRWNGELHEFGTGMLDVLFPIRAAAFMKAQGLPGPLFNDFTNGGYLTWAEPIPGGVYVDGRTEVYDVDFLGPYMQQVANPSAWQAEMDRRDVQTVLFFHWWPNHQPLLRYLIREGRWSLVYYDETSVLLVRAGHGDLVARAAEAFADERKATEERLLAPVDSWQWPVGRARGLSTYATLLQMMGKGADAQRFLRRMHELGS